MRINLRNITKSFGAHSVLEDVSLDLESAQSIVFIGPSGGGKSTLLRIVGGLETPDSGSLTFDGVPLEFDSGSLLKHRRSIGTVFQLFNLFPHLTAIRNITLPLETVHGCSPAEARDRAVELLKRFHLEDHSSKKPAELSGGQRQRVAIARALSIRPKFLLFDEPTSALDPEMSHEVLESILQLREEGRGFILVTHEMNFARRAADFVAVIAGGKIVESGPANAFFENPQSEVAKRFLSLANW